MTRLRTLLLEDSATDAELAVFEMERAGLDVAAERVSTREAFVGALEAFNPEIVLADYSLPSFDGSEALRWMTQHYPRIPVIIVSGALGDERAIELIKAGASDYVLKTNLVRLGPVVMRALEDVRQKQAREKAERALAGTELRYRRLFEAARDGIMIVDADSGAILDVNPFLVQLLDYPADEFLGKKAWETKPFFDVEDDIKKAFATLNKIDYLRCNDICLKARGGARVEIECTGNVCVVDAQRVIQWSLRDVTESRIAAEKAEAERKALLASLEQRVEERTAQLRAMAFALTKAEELERQAIARDLHDGLGQTLAIAKIRLSNLPSEAIRPEAADSFAAVEKLIDQSHRAVRSLAGQLSPPVLYDLGLGPALEWLVEEMERDYELHCNIAMDEIPDLLNQSVRAILFRAVRELLLNIVKHAGAISDPVQIIVTVGDIEAAPQLNILVRDRGRGFDPRQIKRTHIGGFGLMNVHERLSYIGGTVFVDSAPGKGTAVTITAPIPTTG
jgi:PAS domain S-box-containing protein